MTATKIHRCRGRKFVAQIRLARSSLGWAVVIGVFAISTLDAQTHYYTGANNGSWSIDTNWDPIGVPNGSSASGFVGGGKTVHYSIFNGTLSEIWAGMGPEWSPYPGSGTIVMNTGASINLVNAFTLGYSNAAGGYTGNLHVLGGSSIVRPSGGGGSNLMGVNNNANLWIDGAGSSVSLTNTLSIGHSNSTGTASVTNGGSLTAGNLFFGFFAVGQGTIDGTGSTLAATNLLRIGSFGSGTLNIANGAQGSAQTVAIANSAGSTGSLVLSGPGTQFNALGTLSVGGDATAQGGTGLLHVLNGGSVCAGSSINVWSSGQIVLDGGTLCAPSLILSNPATGLSFIDGELNVGALTGDLVQNGGTIAIGGSPGLMTVLGNFTQNSGVVDFEIEGVSRGISFDGLDIAGTASLYGVVQIALTSSFQPSLGQSFDLIDAASIQGSASFDFSRASISHLGLRWDTSTFFADGVLRVSAVPEPRFIYCLGLLCAVVFVRFRPTRRARRFRTM